MLAMLSHVLLMGRVLLLPQTAAQPRTSDGLDSPTFQVRHSMWIVSWRMHSAARRSHCALRSR